MIDSGPKLVEPSRTASRVPGWPQGVALILPVIMTTMGVVALAPIIPRMARQFHTTPVSLLPQLILTAPALFLALFATVAGWLADAVGRRRILLWAMVFYAVLGVLPVVLNDMAAILISRIGVGLTEAVVMVCSTTLISDYFAGAERDKWLAYQTAVGSTSAVLLFAASGLLASALGWRGPFWLYASSLVLLAALVTMTWEPDRSGVAAAAATPASASSDRFPIGPVLGICVLTVLGAIGFFIGQIELAGALAEKHVTAAATIGVMSSCVSLAVPLGSLCFRWLAHRWPLRVQLLAAFGLLGAGLIEAGLAPTVRGMLVGITVNLLGGGLALPSLLTWAMRQLPAQQRGRGTGMWLASFELGQFAASLIATLLVRIVGSLHAAFTVWGTVCLSIGIVAGLAALQLRKWTMSSGRMPEGISQSGNLGERRR